MRANRFLDWWIRSNESRVNELTGACFFTTDHRRYSVELYAITEFQPKNAGHWQTALSSVQFEYCSQNHFAYCQRECRWSPRCAPCAESLRQRQRRPPAPCRQLLGARPCGYALVQTNRAEPGFRQSSSVRSHIQCPRQR